ncbi:hypothetical protein SAMN04488541_1010107 [Thermoflexibacter ruber]|uniref:Viral A-type inclusion protein n=2 Tax=Thermoflexibacter ruber TaxID=1003 RepID=A0A1I2EN15_9BACT|nr:hypothetical protein SAMN04488541_1010107 [Thermoflexibacter ruber]
MKHSYFINYFLILVVSLSFSCISQKTENENRPTLDRQACIAIANLQKEVMLMHDSIMPSISHLVQIKAAVKIKLQEGNISDEHQLKELRTVFNSLDGAEEAMMTWMRNYKTNYEGMRDEEIRSYLLRQKQQIYQVGEKIGESMKKAKVVLASSN